MECDAYRKLSGLKNCALQQNFDSRHHLPPFYGIPITIKQFIKMKGYASTFGLLSRVDQIQKQDGSVVVCFRNSGMIPMYRTAMPQLGMKFETISHLWGRTLNPWDKGRSPGGSSGGEAAAIAIKGSVIGLGTDTGGSLRGPSEFCGLYSIKGARDRVPSDSIIQPLVWFQGNNNIGSTTGPIARSVDDLATWMKIATEQKFYNGKHDPYMKLDLFKPNLYLASQEQKHRIGYILSLQEIQPTPASTRALLIVKDLLSSLGHELIQIQLPNQKQIIGHFVAEAAAQGDLKSFRQALKGEDFISEHSNVEHIYSWKMKVAKYFLKWFSPRLADLLESFEPKKTIYDYLVHGGEIENYKSQWVKYLRDKKIDLVICPGFGMQACLHGASNETSLAASYNFIWNLLDFVAGTQPITVVQPGQEIYRSKHKDILTKKLHQNAQGSQGLPVGIQVIGFPFQEEKVLGLMKKIEKEVKFYSNHPLPEL